MNLFSSAGWSRLTARQFRQGGCQPTAGWVAQHARRESRAKLRQVSKAVSDRRRLKAKVAARLQYRDTVIAQRPGDEHSVARLGWSPLTARSFGAQPMPQLMNSLSDLPFSVTLASAAMMLTPPGASSCMEARTFQFPIEKPSQDEAGGQVPVPRRAWRRQTTVPQTKACRYHARNSERPHARLSR